MKTNRALQKRCYIFGVRTIRFLNERLKSEYEITNQLKRSAPSIGANLIEAKNASTRKEFKRFHEIALRSADESKYWLCLIRDTMNVNPAQLKPLISESQEIAKMLNAGIKKTRKGLSNERDLKLAT